MKLKMRGSNPHGAPDEFILSSLVGKLEEVVVSGKVIIVTYVYFNGTKSSGKNCHVFTFIFIESEPAYILYFASLVKWSKISDFLSDDRGANPL